MSTGLTARERLRLRARGLKPSGLAPAEGIHVDAAELKRAMKIVKPALPRGNGVIQALTGVRITSSHQGAHLTCANLEGACRTAVKAAGTLDSIIPFRELEDALVGASGPVGIIEEDDRTVVTVDGMTVRMEILRAQDWPVVTFDGRAILRADKKLAQVVKRAAVSAGTDQTRPILTGILLDDENGAIAATDSVRLFVADMPGDRTEAFAGKLINPPAKMFVTALTGADDVTLKLQSHRLGRNWLIVDRADRSWALPLIEGTFPKYEKLIPDYSSDAMPDGGVTSIVFDADRVAAAVQKMRRVLRDNAAHTLLAVARERMTVTCERPPKDGEIVDKADANVTVPIIHDDTSDGPAQIKFNAGLLIDALDTTGKSSQVRLQFVHPHKPAVLTDADPTDDTIAVLMPLKMGVQTPPADEEGGED